MGRLSSLLIGTITGASAAYFLTTKRGKEWTSKVKDFVKEYQDNPQEVHDSVKQSAIRKKLKVERSTKTLSSKRSKIRHKMW